MKECCFGAEHTMYTCYIIWVSAGLIMVALIIAIFVLAVGRCKLVQRLNSTSFKVRNVETTKQAQILITNDKLEESKTPSDIVSTSPQKRCLSLNEKIPVSAQTIQGHSSSIDKLDHCKEVNLETTVEGDGDFQVDDVISTETEIFPAPLQQLSVNESLYTQVTKFKQNSKDSTAARCATEGETNDGELADEMQLISNRINENKEEINPHSVTTVAKPSELHAPHQVNEIEYDQLFVVSERNLTFTDDDNYSKVMIMYRSNSTEQDVKKLDESPYDMAES